MKKRILLYFTHKESLGHTTRMLSLISTLISRFNDQAELFIFQAGRKQDFYQVPKKVSWFNLPRPYHSRVNFKQADFFKYSLPIYARLRSAYMLDKIKKIEPDVFITEFFPFGREECGAELLPVLQYLKNRGTRIFASIGYPYIVRTNIKVLLAYGQIYDRFFIHTPPFLESKFLTQDMDDVLKKELYDKIFSTYKNKIAFTGYVLPFDPDKIIPPEKIRDKFRAKNKILIVVSRGGGVRYPKIISHALLAQAKLSKDYVFVVAAGPSSSTQEIAFFKKIIERGPKNRVHFFKYTPDLTSYINACDISISMCGYNTAIQLLYFKKKNILIPSRENPETAMGYCSEQTGRSLLLKKYLGSRVLTYRTFKINDLTEEIIRMRKRSLPAAASQISHHWFDGAQATAKLIVHDDK